MTKKEKYYHLLDKYVSGKLSTQDRHDLEKKALDDPFFFDAMEGWVRMGNTNHSVHLESLQKKIDRKSQSTLARKIIWPIAIAASLILLFTVGNILTDNSDESLVSVTPNKIEVTPAPVISEAVDAKEDPSNDELASDKSVKEVDENLIANSEVASDPPPSPVQEKPLTSVKERKSSAASTGEVASSEVEGLQEAATIDVAKRESSPSVAVETPKRIPLSKVNNPLALNKPQKEMSMAAGVIEILDPDLDIHIKQNLFMRALKVPSGERVSYDLTFDSTLTLTEIKIVSESNKLSESIKGFIQKYESWKKETIPPNLFGRYNYPSRGN